MLPLADSLSYVICKSFDPFEWNVADGCWGRPDQRLYHTDLLWIEAEHITRIAHQLHHTGERDSQLVLWTSPGTRITTSARIPPSDCEYWSKHLTPTFVNIFLDPRHLWWKKANKFDLKVTLWVPCPESTIQVISPESYILKTSFSLFRFNPQS